jgi:hypothetical protein
VLLVVVLLLIASYTSTLLAEVRDPGDEGRDRDA